MEIIWPADAGGRVEAEPTLVAVLILTSSCSSLAILMSKSCLMFVRATISGVGLVKMDGAGTMLVGTAAPAAPVEVG